MSQRFQIEDIITQNPLGVIYHATDVQTDKPVALRRFFPFGADGGGLSPEDQDTFRSLVRRTIGVEHPALRAVIDAGCDPVDAMPFVVTEWVIGQSLAEWMKYSKLEPEQAGLVLATALDVSSLLSQAIGREALWVDTSLSSIIIGDEDSGRSITFWVSSARTLGDAIPQDTLQALVQLAEDLLGWRVRVPGKKTQHGIVQWFNWLRDHAASTSLAEARARLEALTADAEQPVNPAVTVVRMAEPLPPVRMATPSGFFHRVFVGVLVGLAAMVIGAIGWWFLTHRANLSPLAARILMAQPLVGNKPSAVAANPPSPAEPVPSTPVNPPPVIDPATAARNAQAAAMQEELRRREPAHIMTQPVPRPPSNIINPGLAVFAPEQTNELMTRRNHEVTVEGVLVEVILARSGRNLYLEFSKPGPPFLTRGIYYVERNNQMAAHATISPWVGKRVRIHGRVDVERFQAGGTPVERPRILLNGVDSVTLVE